MSRTPVTVRAAVADDLPALRELWGDILRRGSAEEQLADLLRVLEEVEAHTDQAVMVAEYDGAVAGAIHLSATTLTPLNLEPAVLAVSPHVLPQFRRHGVGSALIEAAVRFAEAQGLATISTAAVASSRDANRFMARLSFTPQATLRAATTVAVRAKLSARRSAGRSATRPAGSRHIDRVLAARRISRENIAGSPLLNQAGRRGRRRRRSARHHQRAGINAQVIREVHTRLPRSSEITTSQVAMLRPMCAGVATPVTVPDVAERWCVALMSTPTAIRSGAAAMAEPMDPRLSASTTDAPPWSSP